MTLLLSCQGDLGAGPSRTKETLTIELPTAFGESLERAFEVNPEQTATRILRAHDAFSRIGPVTTQSVKNYTRLERSSDRARIITDILAADLNGDQLITRSEFAVLPELPNGYKKAKRLDGLFEHDANRDGYISLHEAFAFAGHLNAARVEGDMHPIGTYLMLFDLNADGTVVRGEVITALRDYLSNTNKSAQSLRGKQSLP